MSAPIFSDRFIPWLKRMLGVRSRATLELGADLMPSIEILDPQDMTSRWWRGERSLGLGATLAASVGNQSVCGIFNPVGSGILIVVEWFDAISTIAGAQTGWNLFTAAPSGNALNAVSLRDGRPIIAATPGGFGASVRSITGAVSLPSLLRDNNIAGIAPPRSPGPVVLAPGWGLVFGGLGLNQIVDVFAHWYERAAEIDELK